MDLNKLLASLSVEKSEWIGLREVWERTTTRAMRDGKPSSNSAETSHGIMVEVVRDGFFAYAATADRSPAGVRAAYEQASEIAGKANPYSVFKFSPDVRPKSIGKYNSPGDANIAQHNAKELNEFLQEACNRLKISDKISRTIAMTYFVETKHRMVSTSGTDIEQNFSLISTGFEATAMKDNLVQTRSDGGLLANSLQGGLNVLNQKVVLGKLETIAEQAIELLSAPECPSGLYDTVIMPDQMMLQIHESIGHPLEIDRILGDERNYAGSSFVKLPDFGKLTYGSELMNVSFDPTISQEYASYAFDDNGTPAAKEYLIRNGKLLRGLGGVESQLRSGTPGVANARASLWNRPPIDRMANINLEPGTSTFKEIIEAVEDGVLMESNNSWSIDDYRRKFQFGCEYGKRIRNGKIMETIRNPNYRGITVPFWNSLKMLGNEDTVGVYGTPFCGKGEPNQLIRVGHSSPVCLFEKLEIFGGAK